jgi:methionyl aminopeptidase
MDKYEIEMYVKAGEIAKEVKKFTRDLIKPGMKLIDIAEAVDAKILELGGEVAFPVGLGMNEIAAHFTPGVECEEVAEGILKVDIGVAVDGFIGDTAFSVDLTDDGEFEEMIKLNEKILERATEAVRVGMRVCDIGEAVQNVMDECDGNEFVVIKSLNGHSLEKNIVHASPTISNYRNDNKMVLKDVAFAVEPFVTSGIGNIFEGKGGGIYILKNDSQVRDRDARKVLEFVRDNYGGRPFCARWLAKAGFERLRFVLGILVRQGILYEYPILIEKSRKPVSQFENTFVVADNKVVCTTG